MTRKVLTVALGAILIVAFMAAHAKSQIGDSGAGIRSHWTAYMCGAVDWQTRNNLAAGDSESAARTRKASADLGCEDVRKFIGIKAPWEKP